MRRCSTAGHGQPLRRDGHGPVIPGDMRVGVLEMQVRRDLAVLQRQDHFNQAGDAGGGLQVADIGLDRADQQRPVRPPGLPKHAPRAWTSIGSPSDVPVPCAST